MVVYQPPTSWVVGGEERMWGLGSGRSVVETHTTVDTQDFV